MNRNKGAAVKAENRSGRRKSAQLGSRGSRNSKQLAAKLHDGFKHPMAATATALAVQEGNEAQKFDIVGKDLQEFGEEGSRKADWIATGPEVSIRDGNGSADEEAEAEESAEAFSEKRSSGEDLLRLYFRDIGKIPLISDKEVIRLAQMIERARKRKDKSTVTKARKQLVSANLRLVVSIAKKFSNCGMPLLDLVQAGNIGLMKAVDGFNYKLGFKFSTYASKWIQASITRTISNQVRTVRIPVNVIPALKKVDRTSRKLTRELGRKPTTAEIAEGAGVETDKVRTMAQIPQRSISLDFPVDGENGDCTLGEILGDTHSPSTGDIVDKHFFREELDALMREALDEREQEVLKLRYGLLDGAEHTQSEIADYLKLSRQRVSQIENKALMRLRRQIGSESLKSFLN